MFYLKASLIIISAVSALPLSELKTRQLAGRQLISPELIPGTCSWQCGPTIAVPSNCASNDDCLCTSTVANELQYCLNCFVTQSDVGVPANATSSTMSTAIEWANNFNTQCREGGFELPAIFIGEGDLGERQTGTTAAGSPAVPRVSSPVVINPPAPAAPAPASSTLSPTATPSESSSAAPASSPTPTPSPASQSTSSGSSSGLPSVINLGSQTITISNLAPPLNIPANNASGDPSAAAAAAAAANAARTNLKSMADVWIAMMVGAVSVAAAMMF